MVCCVFCFHYRGRAHKNDTQTSMAAQTLGSSHPATHPGNMSHPSLHPNLAIRQLHHMHHLRRGWQRHSLSCRCSSRSSTPATASSGHSTPPPPTHTPLA